MLLDKHGHDGWELTGAFIAADGLPSETWRCSQCGAVHVVRMLDDVRVEEDRHGR